MEGLCNESFARTGSLHSLAERLYLSNPGHSPGTARSGLEHRSVDRAENTIREKPVAELEQVDGLAFYRCEESASLLARLPLIGQWSVIHTLTRRLIEVARQENPDVIHAHSPALNGVAAIRAGRLLGLPVVYEVRGFWEDAAVSHGTSSEGGLRYRLGRAMETWVLKRADEVTCICDGIRNDLIFARDC